MCMSNKSFIIKATNYISFIKINDKSGNVLIKVKLARQYYRTRLNRVQVFMNEI